jgi:hypothetical protein
MGLADLKREALELGMRVWEFKRKCRELYRSGKLGWKTYERLWIIAEGDFVDG